jgi:hypothetical protein
MNWDELKCRQTSTLVEKKYTSIMVLFYLWKSTPSSKEKYSLIQKKVVISRPEE